MPSLAIESIHAREVFDSRGRPTVEVEVTCGSVVGSAIVPSGASTGRHEAKELRDGERGRLGGRGVRRAVENVRTVIAPALVGRDAADQAGIDARLIELDGTADKSRLGANAILGVSLATARAAALASGRPLVEHLSSLWRQSAGDAAGPAAEFLLPLPMVNMISGGLHAGGNLDFQDFLILPVGAESLAQSMEWLVTVYDSLRQVLGDELGEPPLVGDEGGFGPKLQSNEQAVKLIVRAIEEAGYAPGQDIAIGLDVASSHFFESGTYRVEGRELDAAGMIELLAEWTERYPIVSIEDGLAEDDWDGWKRLTDRLGGRVQLIGDDLFVTCPRRLRQGIAAGVANSVLIKLNQIGTLSETFETLRLAQQSGYAPVVSARSGDTEDPFIADLAVATGAGQIKVGSIVRSERLAKYNQLLRLEEHLGKRAAFAGRGALAGSEK